ncbi:Ras-related protein Rab-23 [Durusdinium trenchii]|uniref:Ras-related protein Rab-23 n=1 Tax=Durusdinium trenchii TaxID=1381693 RepID=A0ABP0KGP9_9DINO
MPRRPGTSIKKEEAFTPLPEFEDPDEAIVSSWFADYESSKGNGQGDAAWLASVASAPQRSGRLGVGATLTKAEPAKEMQPLNKAARKAMNRRLRREKEEEEHALEGRLRLQKLRGTGVGSNSGSSEDGEGRAALARSGSGAAGKGDALKLLLAKASASQAAKDGAAARKKERRKRNRRKAGCAEDEQPNPASVRQNSDAWPVFLLWQMSMNNASVPPCLDW